MNEQDVVERQDDSDIVSESFGKVTDDLLVCCTPSGCTSLGVSA